MTYHLQIHDDGKLIADVYGDTKEECEDRTQKIVAALEKHQ